MLELALVRVFGGGSQPRSQHAQARAQNAKAIYICPTRALCNERCSDWERKFGGLGIRVAKWTGDSAQDELPEIESAASGLELEWRVVGDVPVGCRYLGRPILSHRGRAVR